MEQQGSVGDVLSRLRGMGFRVTPARTRLVETLARAKRPLSADEMHEAQSGAADRVTVYRTLEALERCGAILRFTFGNRHVYELAERHGHYLVCRECERVERLPSCSLRGIERTSLAVSKEFASVDHHALQLSGVCRACA